MAVEEISARLRARLQQEYGMDEANILMDRPPGGWGDLVTNRSLDERLAEFAATLDAKLDAKLDHRFEVFEHKLAAWMEREFRAQTRYMVTTIFAAVGTLAAAIGATAALLRL